MHGDFHSDSLKHSDCRKENIFKFAVMNPCFAIIDRNTLSSSKLRELLLKVFPGMEVFTYDTVEGFIKDSNRHFIHFFVSDLLLLSHNEEFDPLKNATTVLSATDTTIIRSGYHILDVSTPEKDIISALKDIRENFRNGACYPDYAGQKDGGHNVLSSREREVLRLLVKGMTSKEIARELDISLPTATFHRNNICSKFGTRSIPRMTIQALLLGLVSTDEI